MVRSGNTSVGVIRNVSLKMVQANTTTIHGTCQTCLCALFADPSLFAFNCFIDNLTCEMYSKLDQNKPFTLVDLAMSVFYFFSFPTYEPSPTTALIIPALTTVPTREFFSHVVDTGLIGFL